MMDTSALTPYLSGSGGVDFSQILGSPMWQQLLQWMSQGGSQQGQRTYSPTPAWAAGGSPSPYMNTPTFPAGGGLPTGGPPSWPFPSAPQWGQQGQPGVGSALAQLGQSRGGGQGFSPQGGMGWRNFGPVASQQ